MLICSWWGRRDVAQSHRHRDSGSYHACWCNAEHRGTWWCTRPHPHTSSHLASNGNLDDTGTARARQEAWHVFTVICPTNSFAQVCSPNKEKYKRTLKPILRSSQSCEQPLSLLLRHSLMKQFLSSEPSPQSFLLSHSNVSFTHLPLVHRKPESLQRLSMDKNKTTTYHISALGPMNISV